MVVSVQSSLYFTFGCCIAGYFGVLILLNWIPNFSIKSFGWLKAKHISIDLKHLSIYIRRAKLNINPFNENKFSFKVINFQLYDIEVKLKRGTELQDFDEKKRKAGFPPQTGTSLSINLPGNDKIVKILIRFLSYINLHLLGISIYTENEKPEEKKELLSLIRYVRIENRLRTSGESTMVVNMFNGLFHDKSAEKKENTFRMVEMSVSFEGTIDSKSRTCITYSMANIRLQLSIAKLSISLNEKDFSFGNKPVSKKKDLSTVKYQLHSLSDYLDLFNSAEVKLEDPYMELGHQKVSASNLMFAINSERRKTERALTLILLAGSLRVLDKERKTFQLESATFNFQAGFSDLGEVIQSLQDPVSNSNRADIRLSLLLNNGSIDVFYDQLYKLSNSGSTTSANSDRDLQSFTKIFKNISFKIVMMGMKLNLHLPGLLDESANEFDRGSSSNFTTVFAVSSLFAKISTKRIHQLSRRTLSNSDERSLNLIFKMKALEINAEENFIIFSNVRLLAAYDILHKTCSVVLKNRRIGVKQNNYKFLAIVRQLEKLKNLAGNKSALTRTKHQKEKAFETGSVYLSIDKILPEKLCVLKIKISVIECDLLSNDYLPPCSIKIPGSDELRNLKDLKHGLAVKCDQLNVKYDRRSRGFDSSFQKIQVFNIGDKILEHDFVDSEDGSSSSESEVSDVSTIDSLLSNDNQAGETDYNKLDRIFILDNVNFGVSPSNSYNFELNIKQVTGDIDVNVVWILIYFLTLAKYFKPNKDENHTMETKKSIPRVLLNVNVGSIGLVSKLPNNVKVLFEVDNLKAINVLSGERVSSRFSRLYVIQPSCRIWTRLLTLGDLSLQREIADNEELNVVAHTSLIKLIIPQQFLLYTVIDNLITFGKTIRQIKYNFDDLFFGDKLFKTKFPGIMSPPSLPTIKLKSDKLGLCIEGDPFENELGFIFELGSIEQKLRLKKLKAFEQRFNDFEELSSSLEEKIKLSNTAPLRQKLNMFDGRKDRDIIFQEVGNKNGQDLKNSKAGFEANVLPQDVMTDNDISHSNDGDTPEYDHEDLLRLRRIEEARGALYEDFSNSWINKFKIFKAIKVRKWKNLSTRVWGKDVISNLMLSQFNILNEARGPDILNAIFSDFNVTLGPSTIDDIDAFLKKHGKGQPKLEYSILFPFHLRLQSNSFYAWLRDYPLPLVAFPENDNKDRKTIDLAGNFVINEKLITRKEELRFIHVPFLSMMGDSMKESFYCCDIPRTLTPVKFMFDLECGISTEKACNLTWCRSYQPALSSVGTALDNFSKPPIDDSQLGSWDKLALIAHGKLLFNFDNELSLHMKGSSDPYDLIGRASGLVFCWKNDVRLQIGGREDTEALISLDSNEFILGIPNYAKHKGNAWSVVSSMDASDNVQGRNKFSKKVIELASCNRVRWTLDFAFERNKDRTSILSKSKEKTNTFRPHYEIMVTNPMFDFHPDSYDGYRSDYVHLSLSVTSAAETGMCYNAAHFSPMTFHYLFHWWDLMTDYIALPIREGNLFNNKHDKTHLKFGTHLFSVSYMLNFKPLTIAHMYMDTTSLDENTHKTNFTGVKGSFGSCVIDLHQMKEMVTYVNDKLNIKNEILHLKMTAGEIDVEEADFRIIDAVYDENSLKGYLMSCLAKGDHASFDKCPLNASNADVESSSGESEISKKVFSWVDWNDYLELETFDKLLSEPEVEVLPFFYTPKFNYYRRFSWEQDVTSPFRGQVHDCILDHEDPSYVQRKLLKSRSDCIANKISHKEELLHKLQNEQSSDSQNERFEREIQELKDRQTLVNNIDEGFKGSVYDSSTSSVDESELTEMDTSQYSIYSSQKSLYDIKDMTDLNSKDSKFHNKFIFHNIQMKWDNKLKSKFVQYIQNVSDRRSMVYFMSKQGADLVDSVVRNSKLEEECTREFEKPTPPSTNVNPFSGDVRNFDQILNELSSEDNEINNKYLIKFIHPQIQLTSDLVPDSSALVTSRDVELRVINVNLKGMDHIISESAEVSGLVETRIGALFNDYHTFVIDKGENAIENSERPYGADYCSAPFNWPPWVEIEVFYDASWLRNNLVIERTSSMLVLKKPNALTSESSNDPKISEMALSVSKLVVNVDSKQYTTFYFVLLDLLLKLKTEKDKLMSKLDKFVTVFDSNDFEMFENRVKELQESIREYRVMILQLFNSDYLLEPEEKISIARARVELEKMKIELIVLMRGVGLKNSKIGHKNQSTVIQTVSDQVIWHALDERREPFVDFALAKTSFVSSQSLEGTFFNTFEIEMLQGFNLQTNALYPEMLQPLKDNNLPDQNSSPDQEEPVISVTWSMLNPVGGIRIIEDANMRIKPFKIEIDYSTTKRLFEFFFPQDETNSKRNLEYSDDLSEVSEASESQLSQESAESGQTLHNHLKSLLKFGSGPKKQSNNGQETDTDSESSTSLHTSSSSKFSTSEASTKSTSKETNHKPDSNEKVSMPDIDDFTLILNRSSKFFSILNVEISDLFLMISFKAPKHLHILNVSSLGLSIPKIHYENEVWSGQDFVMRLKRDIIRIILVNTGKILGNKFKHRKQRVQNEPLKQIADYASYMTIQDLQSEGRDRDFSNTKVLNHFYHNSKHHRQNRINGNGRVSGDEIDHLLESLDNESNYDAS